jgi:hypothetical protein
VLLSVRQEAGKTLHLDIDGVPAITDIFPPAEIPLDFLAAQWRHFCWSTRVPKGFDGPQLVRALISVRRTNQQALRGAVVDLDVELQGLDQEIAEKEADMNTLVSCLYDLSPAETSIINSSWG